MQIFGLCSTSYDFKNITFKNITKYRYHKYKQLFSSDWGGGGGF